jgi:AbrB family looped-hinge helix DNA binding protein
MTSYIQCQKLMSKNISNDIIIRDKRQITLPRKLCEQLGVEPGDRLLLNVEGDKLVAKPKKSVALNALQELHRIFQTSDVTEKELLKTARRIRRELVAKEYGRKA